MVHRRVGGLLRDAWYLAVVVLLSSVGLWLLIAPLVGILVMVLSLCTFVYFAVVRYDDDGNERTDTRA